eukprot:2677194-Pleurochrysis_carterae.AAC.1
MDMPSAKERNPRPRCDRELASCRLSPSSFKTLLRLLARTEQPSDVRILISSSVRELDSSSAGSARSGVALGLLCEGV